MTNICSAGDVAAEARTRVPAAATIPPAVYAFSAGIFAMTTSEFMVAGLMPELSAAFAITTAQVGYLISIYSAGMVMGGPVLTMTLLRIRPKTALVVMMLAFIVGQGLAAAAPSYAVLALGRFITGATSAACFAISLSTAATIAGPQARGRAASVVLAGLMLSTVLGVPISTILGQSFDWRASFWIVALLVAISTVLVATMAPRGLGPQGVDLRSELRALANGRLWAAYATSGLIIAATFAPFSYFAPIFIEVTGFNAALVPYLFGLYGVATVVGNIVIGRFADRYTMPILVAGLVVMTVTLALFGIFARQPIPTVALTIMLGLVGVTLNPAMVARVMRRPIRARWSTRCMAPSFRWAC